MSKRINKTTTLNKRSNPPGNIFLFKDDLGQETYLRIKDNYTWEEIQGLYFRLRKPSKLREFVNKAFGDAYINNYLPHMDAVEWAIREQLMVLLTDEEVREVEKQNEGITANN
jgi:hypothetical protein